VLFCSPRALLGVFLLLGPIGHANTLVEIKQNTVVLKEPRKKSQALADVEAGTLLTLERVSKNGHWVLLKDEDGNQGWVPKRLTSLSAPASTKPKTPETPRSSPASAEPDPPKNEEPDQEDRAEEDLKLGRDTSSLSLAWRLEFHAQRFRGTPWEYPTRIGVGVSELRWSVEGRSLSESQSWFGIEVKTQRLENWGVGVSALYSGSSGRLGSGVDLGLWDGDRWDFGYTVVYKFGGMIHASMRIGALSGPWNFGASLGLGAIL
jgi:hypothetical protein